MADYDNGLPPVMQSEGGISSVSFQQKVYKDSDCLHINNLSVQKEMYAKSNRVNQINSIACTKEVYIEKNSAENKLLSLTLESNEIGYSSGMYL